MNKYPELVKETILISNFFANEFAKVETVHDYNYLISACFTEIIVSKGFDGILYPSVRVGGQGFNLAIQPDIADNALKLVGAGECLIYKNKDKIFVDNETLIELKPNQSNFKFLPVSAKYHAGEDYSLREIGMTSLDELMK